MSVPASRSDPTGVHEQGLASTTVAGRGPTLLFALLAVLTAVVLELMRASGPFVDYAFTQGKLLGAVGAGLVTYAAPGLVAAVLLWLTRSRVGTAALIGVALLTSMRLVAQALDGLVQLYVGLATVAVGICVLVLAAALLAGAAGGRAVPMAIGVGAAGSVGVQLALTTWDAFWRTDVVGWLVSAALATTTVGLALAIRRDGVPQPTVSPRRTWVLGPLLSLLLLVLANPAFAASQADVPLAVAGPVLGLGLLLAAWVASRAGSPSIALLLGPPLLLGAVMALGAPMPEGPSLVTALLVLTALVGSQSAVLSAAARALGGGARPASVARLAGAATLTGLGAILPVMIYQVAYEVPLGFPNEWVVVAAAALLSLGALSRAPEARALSTPVWALAAAASLLVAGSAVAGVQAVGVSDPPTDGASGTGLVMVWNVHYAVDGSGRLDPESIARVVETYDPDVLLVNELPSGWILAGGMDVGTWLSQRLDRPIAVGAAADRQFGSGVLSRWRIEDTEAHALPQGSGSQERTALSARVVVGDDLLDVVSVQLQNKAANASTRVLQAEALVDAVDGLGGGPVLVGGDLNANPGTEAVEVLTGAGLVSSLDELGLGDALTYPASSPEQRLDWLLGRDVTFVEAEVLTEVTNADHLPILVTVRP